MKYFSKGFFAIAFFVLVLAQAFQISSAKTSPLTIQDVAGTYSLTYEIDYKSGKYKSTKTPLTATATITANSTSTTDGTFVATTGTGTTITTVLTGTVSVKGKRLNWTLDTTTQQTVDAEIKNALLAAYSSLTSPVVTPKPTVSYTSFPVKKMATAITIGKGAFGTSGKITGTMINKKGKTVNKKYPYTGKVTITFGAKA